MRNKLSTPVLEKFATFGDLLQFLRRRAGLTQLELSIAVGYSSSQISRLEQNLRLPDPPVIHARFVPALFLEDEPLAAARLLELAETVRKEDAPARGICPFKGLDYFDEPDADIFVGRERLTETVTRRILSVGTEPKSGQCGFLAIVGASGSGKSSLVRAGVVPALRWNKTSANWPIHVLTPGPHPLESLATNLAHEKGTLAGIATLMDDLARDRRSLSLYITQEFKTCVNKYVLLIIDQFEELFTLCHAEEERSAFIDSLTTAVSVDQGSVILMITLRADFYAHCASYVQLRQLLANHQEYIGAMNDDEMRRAIEEPAKRGHWEFEPGLVDLILHDVGHEPGALPLLSHALFETWQRRHGRLMTLSGYISAGGVRCAIAETAEAVFTDQFNHQQQAIARCIFIRLTELGDQSSSGDTRRRATLGELILRPEDAVATQTVLKALADARLITTTENSIQVAHEALIHEWPTLRGWLEENREGLRLHRHIIDSTGDWLAAGREPGMLLRGARLAQAKEWATSFTSDMNELEREYLAASVAYAESEAAEREALRQHELAAAQKLADSETQRAEEKERFAYQLRRRAILISITGFLAVLLAIFSIFAWQRSASNAVINQSLNLARAAEQANASGRGDLALALAGEAVELNQKSAEVLQALREVASSPGTRAILNGHSHSVTTVAISPDARTAVSGSCAALDSAGACQAGELVLWDLATHQILQRWPAHAGWVTAVAFSPDGRSVISGGTDGNLIQWSKEAQEIRRFIGHSAAITDLAVVSSIGGLLSASSDGSLILWSLNSANILQRYESSPIPITSIAAASGSLMAVSAQKDGSLALWNLFKAQPINVFRSMGTNIKSVAISRDGSWILYTNNMIPDLFVRKIDIQTGNILNQHNFDCSPGDIVLSPDGSVMFITCQAAIYKMSIDDFENQQSYLDSPDSINDIAISQNSQLALSASTDGTLRLWNLGMQPAYDVVDINADRLSAFDISPDGNYLLINDATENGIDQPVLWSPWIHSVLGIYSGFTGVVNPGAVAISRDKGLAAIAGWSRDLDNPDNLDLALMVWDFSHQVLYCSYKDLDAPVRALLFSPDSKFLLIGTYDINNKSGKLLLLEPRTCQLRHEFESGEAVSSIAFNFDGSQVVTGMGYRGRVVLWEFPSGVEINSYNFSNYGAILPAAFGPDGSQILSAGPADLFLVSVASGNITRSYSISGETPTSLSISLDGKYIVSGASGGNIILWDYTTGEELQRISLHDQVVEVKFSPDSSMVYAITESRKLIEWPIAGQSLTELLKWIDANRYIRPLTCLERQQYHVEPRCKP